MERLIEKIQYVPYKIFLVFSGPPRVYWGTFVVFSFVFFIGAFLFDVSIYFKTAQSITAEEPFTVDVRLEKVNEKALNHILDMLSENEKAMQKILEAPFISDPSR